MTTTHQPHVVTGAGPVGATVALQLAGRGIPVRLLTRSGSGPDHELIERRRVDVSDREALAPHLEGVAAVHHCIHGSKYRASAWRAELPAAEQVVLDLAGEVGAVVVFPESLYSYGQVDGVIHEDTPRTATQGKLGIRADLLRAREASPTHTVSVVSSDFFGPVSGCPMAASDWCRRSLPARRSTSWAAWTSRTRSPTSRTWRGRW